MATFPVVIPERGVIKVFGPFPGYEMGITDIYPASVLYVFGLLLVHNGVI